MKATSFRLPDSTAAQLDRLMHALDMTRTQVLIVALDRLYGEVFGKRKGAGRKGGDGKPDSRRAVR